MENETLLFTEINVETGETIERQLTAEEIAEREEMQSEAETRQAKQEAKAAARTSALAKLAELGLTEEEVAAL
jgi:hypothetical protein